MAKKRVIDTEGLYYDEEFVRLLGAKGLHLYIRLWSLADDFGGYDPNYFEISQKMGALKIRPWRVKRLIKKLMKAGKVIPYFVDGREYHWIKRFQKHQALHKPNLPKLPVPEWIDYQVGVYPKSGRKYAIYTPILEKVPSQPLGQSEDSPRTVRARTETKDIYILSTKSKQGDQKVKKGGNGKEPVSGPPEEFRTLMKGLQEKKIPV